MSIRVAGQLSIAIAVLVLASFGFVASVRAQDSGDRVKLTNADVREALSQVFKRMNISYTISPEVNGRITVEMNNVSFQQELESILRQVDATYRIEAGVYEIIPKRPTSGALEVGGSGGAQFFGAPPAVSVISDNRYLYVISGGTVVKIEKSDLKIVKTAQLPFFFGSNPPVGTNRY